MNPSQEKTSPVAFSTLLSRVLQKTAISPTLELLQTHWQDWFQGTDLQHTIPERLDRWKGLWIRVPNAIVRQKLQFQSEKFLNVLNALLPEKIQSIHWKL
ncbi:MAG: DUF721 domain-containing protein [Opitutales bacterium]|nr:DUF721 domain-containing protein [Opitutales bacterium]